MSNYILIIGDSIVNSGTKAELLPKYNTQLKLFKESGDRPSKKPTIYKLDKEPSK